MKIQVLEYPIPPRPAARPAVTKTVKTVKIVPPKKI